MPNLKLTDLVPISAGQLTGDDLLYIVENTTNTSRKITFDSLANTRLNTLSSYDIKNTTNINFLSSSIDDNTTRLDNGDTTNTAITNDIEFLSGSIGTNTSNILAVSADVVNNSLGTLVSDVLILSGDVQSLSSLARENEDTFTSTDADIAFLSGAIDTTYPSADATKVSFITITQAVNLDTLETTANAAIPLATLKTEVAASTDFADFKSRIAAL